MKRDMELIKATLLNLEDCSGHLIPENYTDLQKMYHASLCVEAGLVHGNIVYDEDGDVANVAMWSLTWEGHEFLDAARNDTVWNSTMDTLKQKAISVPFSLLAAYLKFKVKEITGLGVE